LQDKKQQQHMAIISRRMCGHMCSAKATCTTSSSRHTKQYCHACSL
jgi:hypothetical protein